MQEFDKDGDGTVNCAEFLLTFFRVGFDTRNKALQRRVASRNFTILEPVFKCVALVRVTENHTPGTDVPLSTPRM